MSAYFYLLWGLIKIVKSANVIDMDDILSVDYMPGSLLMLENPESYAFINSSGKQVNDHFENIGGKFENAFETMGFHRKMMNEYLCRNFIAEQIVSDLTLTRLKRRLGKYPNKSSNSTESRSSLRSNLIDDEGSTNYKSWLTKSTTLEDIYRHYERGRKQDDQDEEKEEEEYDTNIAGYPFQSGQSSKIGHGPTGNVYPYAPGSPYSFPGPPMHSGHGYGLADQNMYGTSHGVDNAVHITYGATGDNSGYDNQGGHFNSESFEHYSSGGNIKEHDLTDLFDIALTALAFLSFGMFIIHVIMCISLAINSSSTTMAAMMMPMSMIPTGMDGNAEGTNSDKGNIAEGSIVGNGELIMGGEDNNMTPIPTTEMTIMTIGVNKRPGSTVTSTTPTSYMTSITTMGDSFYEGMDNTENINFMSNHMTAPGMDMINFNMVPGMVEDDINIPYEDEGLTGTGTGTANEPGGNIGGGYVGDGINTQPTGGDSTGTGTGMDAGDNPDTREEILVRLRRDATGKANNLAINELARKILTSMEAALVANQDGGNCLRKTLCENNRYSRSLTDNGKIWIPVWSLGMSWLSGKLNKDIPMATSMLDSLKASILGLGKANCEVIFQECNLKEERRRRKRRSIDRKRN